METIKEIFKNFLTFEILLIILYILSSLFFFKTSDFNNTILYIAIIIISFFNIIICPIVYIIIHKFSWWISLLFLISSIYLLVVIQNNYDDFSDYKYWEFYNRQPVLSKNLDYFIGENLFAINLSLKIVLGNYILSYFLILLNKWKKN